jgi:hypothetical protein
MVSILYIIQPNLCMPLSLAHLRLMLSLSLPSSSDHQNAICWGVQCMKHLIIQYYSAICFFKLNPNFFFSSLFLTTVSLFFLLIWHTKFHARIKQQNYISNESPTRCKIFQFTVLTFIYSSTCFGRFPAHNHELDDYSGSLWFYLPILVKVVLCL